MSVALLAALVLALALPAAGRADGAPPPAPLAGPVPCDAPSCAGPQGIAGQTDPNGAEAPAPLPVENERLADYFLFALLTSLLVIVPFIVTRQRAGRDGSSGHRPSAIVLRLVAARSRRRRWI